MKTVIGFLLGIMMATPACADMHTIYLTRHYEKAKMERDPALTSIGQQRAEALAKWLEGKNVTHVMSTDYRRTQQTAAPFALRSGLSVDSYHPANLEALAEALINAKKNTLVVGHSNTTPALLKHLGGPEVFIEESEFGDMFIVNVNGDVIEVEQVEISLQ